MHCALQRAVCFSPLTWSVYLVPALCVAVSVAGCTSMAQRRLWKEAERADEVTAYQHFIARYPAGERSQRARARLEEMLAALRRVATVRLLVDETYFAATKGRDLSGFSVPFHDPATELLRFAGVAVDQQTDGVDAVVEIQAEGKALGLSYGVPDERQIMTATSVKSWQFTGARLWGTLVLAAADAVYRQQFQVTIAPPDRIPGVRFDSPRDAPFVAAMHLSFLPTLAQMVGVIHGPGPLITALRNGSIPIKSGVAAALGVGNLDGATSALIERLQNDSNPRVRVSAAEALGRTRSREAVDPLIATLRDEYDFAVREKAAAALGGMTDLRAVEPLITAMATDAHPVRVQAAESLRTLTGKRFGLDSDAWAEWWASENRTPIRRPKGTSKETSN